MSTTVEVSNRKRGALLVLCLVVIISIGSCVAGIRAFFDEDRNPVRRFMVGKTIPATHLQVDAIVTLIDPLRDMMKVRLEFHPKGELLEKNGHDIARDVHFLTDNAGGQSEHVFKKHHQAHPVELTLSLFNGDIALYPVDEYQASLQFEAYLEAGSEDETPVPLVVNFVSKNHGLHVEAEMDNTSEPHELSIDLKLKRPAVIQGFAWFVNFLMVVLAVSSSIVVYNVAYRGKKLEPNLLVWMSALLFVLPSLRSTLPGVPPLGAFTDYLVFFWVEGVIALCLFIMVLTWYGRVPDK